MPVVALAPGGFNALIYNAVGPSSQNVAHSHPISTDPTPRIPHPLRHPRHGFSFSHPGPPSHPSSIFRVYSFRPHWDERCRNSSRVASERARLAVVPVLSSIDPSCPRSARAHPLIQRQARPLGSDVAIPLPFPRLRLCACPGPPITAGYVRGPLLTIPARPLTPWAPYIQRSLLPPPFPPRLPLLPPLCTRINPVQRSASRGA